jgi:GNAT superfamily N-acetyltransferase
MTDVRTERPSDRPPEHHPAFALLADGRIVEIRLATPADLDEVHRLHEEMSDDNKRMRFYGAGKRAGEKSAHRICDQPRPGYAGLVAVLNSRIVGVAEYTCAEESGQAEVAFAVEESYHGRGVGTLLLEHLAVTARRNGFESSSHTCCPTTTTCGASSPMRVCRLPRKSTTGRAGSWST